MFWRSDNTQFKSRSLAVCNARQFCSWITCYSYVIPTVFLWLKGVRVLFWEGVARFSNSTRPYPKISEFVRGIAKTSEDFGRRSEYFVIYWDNWSLSVSWRDARSKFSTHKHESWQVNHVRELSLPSFSIAISGCLRFQTLKASIQDPVIQELNFLIIILQSKYGCFINLEDWVRSVGDRNFFRLPIVSSMHRTVFREIWSREQFPISNVFHPEMSNMLALPAIGRSKAVLTVCES